MNDAVIISDLHLGSAACRVKAIEELLDNLPPTKRLVLNGDVLENTEHRLNKHHWKVLSKLRKLSDDVTIIWVQGNHDADADAIAHLIGAHFCEEFVFTSGSKSILVVHGDRWDKFISKHPFLTALADWFYNRLQGFSRSFAAKAKRNSKGFQRLAGRVMAGAVSYAKSLGCSTVICGHTHCYVDHDQVSGCGYINTGCWTDDVAHYLEVKHGETILMEVRT